MRSSTLRLNSTREKGPKSLKCIEFSSQLNQYQELSEFNWYLCKDIPLFVEKTFQLLERKNKYLNASFGLPPLQCLQCKKIRCFKKRTIYQVDSSALSNATQDFISKKVIETFIDDNELDKCCKENLQALSSDTIYFILKFSDSVNIELVNSMCWYGKNVAMISFLSEEIDNQEISYRGYFRLGEEIFHQTDGHIKSSSIKNLRVKMIAYRLCYVNEERNLKKLNKLVYDAKILKRMYKVYLANTCPEKFAENILKTKEYESQRAHNLDRQLYKRALDDVRDKSEPRKKYHRIVDKVRDITDSRKDMHQKIDANRDKEEKRKQMHKALDKQRDQEETRKQMHKTIDDGRKENEQRKKTKRKSDCQRDQRDDRKRMHTIIDQDRFG